MILECFESSINVTRISNMVQSLVLVKIIIFTLKKAIHYVILSSFGYLILLIQSKL